MSIDISTPLGELVRDRPQAAAVLKRLGIDYCCGGQRTLAEACAQRQIDPATVAVLLATAPQAGVDDASDAHDVARASITELCDHILIRHHGPLHHAFDRISHLLATVARVHGKDHPELIDVQRLFQTARDELATHMQIEETELFPACRALDAGQAPREAGFDRALIALLEDDHAATGAALVALRELSGGYDTSAALCSTHKTTLTELHAFERDLHQHVHEENNILFPRVREALAAAA